MPPRIAGRAWVIAGALTQSAVLVSLLLASPTLLQAQRPASIVGVVVDARGYAIPGVRIAATEGLEGSSWHTTVTGPNGQFRLDPLPPNTYWLFASMPGFRFAFCPEVLAGGREAPYVLTLQVGRLGSDVPSLGCAVGDFDAVPGVRTVSPGQPSRD